jgi:hypothetical protein
MGSRYYKSTVDPPGGDSPSLTVKTLIPARIGALCLQRGLTHP